MNKNKEKVLLIVLDGIGEGKNYKYNAVKKAKTPYLNALKAGYPSTLLNTNGNAVGLPRNTMGGSEVGHYTMGAGRIVYQSLEEINRKIKSKELFNNKELKKLIQNAKKNSLHLIGMISDAGVHSHIKHLINLLKFAKENEVKNIYIHAITDGRDTEEKMAKKFVKMIQKTKIGEISTIIGRYYAMDRDSNFERTKKAYELLVNAKGEKENDALKAIENAYKKGVKTDYYIPAISLNKDAKIKENDSIVFTNFRSDRAHQLTKALTDKNFNKFPRKIKNYKNFLAFGPYIESKRNLFPSPKIKNNLSEILSKKGLTQLKIAETEKFAHVTFFFNSQNKIPFKNETHILIPSPKVPSYDLKPEMSAKKVTQILIKEISKDYYNFILLNYANGDLVGHSGNFEATVKAVECLDECLKKLIPIAQKHNYQIIITADHGNAEYMKYENGENCASHTLNPVNCTIISKNDIKIKNNKSLNLSNIAPTVLELMKIKKAKEMTASSLIKKTKPHNKKKAHQ